MEVEYELTPEDIRAFQRYHQKHPLVPPKGRLIAFFVWIVFLVGTAGFLMLPRQIFLPELDVLLGLVPGAAVGMLLTLVGLSLYARFIQSNAIRKTLQEGRNEEKSLGWRRLSIDPHAIRTASAFSSSSFFWEGLDAVVATDDYAFLYITTRMAHVIPRRAFPDDRAFDDFVEMARRYRRMGGIAKEGQRVPEEAPRVQPPPVPGDERLTQNRDPG
jgi:YcxB-like protein